MGNTHQVSDSKRTDNVSVDTENFSFGTATLPNVNNSQENTLAVSANQTDKKSSNKKKGRTDDKKKEDSFSYRNNFPTDVLDSKTDMYELNPDDDFDRLYLQTQAPAVPELIVDVLKAEVNSDKSDGYSTIESLDMDFLNSNSAETKNNEDLDQLDANVQNNNELVSEDTKQNTDSGLNYPIIFRRSKKDPGSKQYNELVKELSTVLKKRSETARAQSMHEETSASTLGVDLKTISVERKHVSKSSQNLNVFANKSLLNKLENHIANRNLTNKFANDERRENRPDDIRKINSSTDYSSRINVNKDKDLENIESFSNLHDAESLYSTPVKQKTYVTNDNVTVINSEQTNFTSNKDIDYEQATMVPGYGQNERRKAHNDLSFHSNITRFPERAVSAYEVEMKSANRVSSSSIVSAEKDTVTLYRNYNDGDNQSTAHSSYFVQSGEVSEVPSSDTRHIVNNGFSHATNNRNGGNIVVNNVHYNPVTTSEYGQPTTSSVRLSGQSADDNWTLGQGRTTKVTVSGRRLSRENKMMKSEPNLTYIDSPTSDTNPGRHFGNSYYETSEITSPRIKLPSDSSSMARTKHYVANHRHHHHYRSLDNLLSDSSSEKSGNVFVVQSANTSFLHNYSYDVSFDHESFDEYDGSQSDASSSLNSHVVKVNIGTTYFGSSTDSHDDHFRPGNIIRSSDNTFSSLPRHAFKTTSIDNSNVISDNLGVGNSSQWSSSFAEHSQSLDRRTTVPRAISLRSTASSSSSHASSRSKIAKSHTIDRNLYDQRHVGHPHNHLYIKHSPKRNTSFTANPKSDGSTSVSSPDVPASKLFIVVPPQPNQVRVPDLIVDLQQPQPQKQKQPHGSPFLQEIGEGALPTVHGDGLHKGEEDKPAHFYIDARNLKGTPSVQVDGPNAIAKCSIDPLKDGQYKVTYIPVEVGLFDVYVRWNDRELPGSPFHPQIVDSRKVKVIGGWQHYMDGQERIHLVVGEEKQIPFDTSEAGPGQLRAEIKSPSSLLPVEVDDSQKGRSVVKFTPREEGKHLIYLHWSDHPLVNSPYLGHATGGVADPSKVWLTGRGLKEAVVKEEAEFTIDGSQAGPGEPDVELTGVRAEIPVITTPLGGGKYRCTYIPVIPGAYLLNISWNGRQLRGAPYKVNVIGASYPDRVVVNGDGLNGGLLGQSLNFRIDTRKAGPGELTAYCMGPTKVAYCELQDHHDGIYSLVIRPQEAGRHTLQIKYGGENVQGSPYKFKVSAQPDASKVRVSGPGVEHGILAHFQSQFFVETKGAGAGQLTVRIRGPKGAFQVEMYRESQKDRTILCRYYPSVTGLYIISVRWSGVDVPGSPFQVHILDTQQELEQVLHEASFTGSGHHHHLVSPNNTSLQNSTSFHNSSMGSSNYVRQSAHQNGYHHNVSRNSSHYQWN